MVKSVKCDCDIALIPLSKNFPVVFEFQWTLSGVVIEISISPKNKSPMGVVMKCLVEISPIDIAFSGVSLNTQKHALLWCYQKSHCKMMY